jgi:prepilin-type N-terminal cleavage/methylation domain-containing protein
MPALRPPLHASPALRRGLTLTEVIISMVVFTIVSLGVLTIVTQIRHMSENTVYENTALTMAQGYIEQVRSLSYNDLVTAANDNTAPLTLKSANGGGTRLTNEAGGVLTAGAWARERVFLDRDAANRETQPLNFRFRVTLVDLNNASLVAIRPLGVEIILDYEYQLPDARRVTITRSIRNVRSVVPSY